MTNDKDIRNLADAFFSALERGDAAAVADCYAPEMRIWNNVQQVEMTGADHIAGLEAVLFTQFSDRVYENKRTDLLPDGFVRQQALVAMVGGQPVRIPMCLICRVADGRISRIDEYLTVSALPPMIEER